MPSLGRRPIAAALALVAGLAILVGAGTVRPPAVGPAPSASSAAGGLVPPSPEPGAASARPSAAPPGASGSPVGPPSPSPSPVRVVVPIVPVVDYRSAETSVAEADVRATLDGRSPTYDALELVASDADAILAALDLERPADRRRLVLARDPSRLAADLARHRDRLGLVRADAVTPAVRALGWEGRSLFGVGRVRSLDEWPLTALLVPGPEGDGPVGPFDPAGLWTLVAGGDILLDRGVARQVKVLGKGVDFPFDGGTAEITGRFCCSAFGWPLPRTRRTGDAGAVRELLRDADLAIANFENPAPDRFRYHTRGTVFSADPALIEGLANAGIDWVSLANNHIGDAGRAGIVQTIENLDEWGIAHGGAGRNVVEAHEPSILEAPGGVRVAILAYDAIAAVYAAGPDRPGSARLSVAAVRRDVRAARAAGADVVVVFPHWGVEYRARPTAGQRELAEAIVDAGADMIIGNHAHWAAALEVRDGRPIWYALGNFVFDQAWSEPTMEGLTLELTFRGATLVQATMRPHIVLDQAQPNFLDPAGDGRVVLDQVFEASRGLLPW